MVDPSALGIPWKRQLWHKWKAIRKVPFRRSWFIGYDLEGNSYWELVDHNNPSRLRRKVSLDKPYFHFSDFKPHPMWMQWLQFTRNTSPGLSDLINDAKRQHRLKLLAQQAEAKWKSVPLKSSGTGKGEDPRIGSAWSGIAVTPDTEPQARSEESTAADKSQHDSSDDKIRRAMEEAQSLGNKGTKVVRDHLGQVKVEKTTDSQKK